MALAERLRAVLSALEEAEEELRARLARLPVGGGCTLDHRWVRSNGGRYWYWYLVCYSNGRRRHVYLGKTVPEEVFRSRALAAEGRALARRLRVIAEARARAERRIAEAEARLREALAVLEAAAVRAEAAVAEG